MAEESPTFTRTLDQDRTSIPQSSVTRRLIRSSLSWKVRFLNLDLRLKWVLVLIYALLCDSVRSYRFDPSLR